jgi:hypothetical protein
MLFYRVLCVCLLQLGEALTAIKAAMTWDEAAFGREYDLVRAWGMLGLCASAFAPHICSGLEQMQQVQACVESAAM